MPQPVVAEIAYVIKRLSRSKRKDALASRFELLKTEIRRVAWSDEVSEAFGDIKSRLERKGERIEDFDAAVAAHAMAGGCVLVTANLKHMTRVAGLQVEDWSEELETSPPSAQRSGVQLRAHQQNSSWQVATRVGETIGAVGSCEYFSRGSRTVEIDRQVDRRIYDIMRRFRFAESVPHMLAVRSAP